jgi:hypothetical protein
MQLHVKSMTDIKGRLQFWRSEVPDDGLLRPKQVVKSENSREQSGCIVDGTVVYIPCVNVIEMQQNA